MGQLFVEVRPEDKAVALVEGENAHKWKTLWPGALVSVKSVSREVAPLGSPKFYLKVEQDINKRHFLDDPAYFVSAIIAEQALLVVPTAQKQDQPPQRTTKTKIELKKDVERLTGLPQNEINSNWDVVDSHFTKNAKTVYQVENPESFGFTVEEPWRSYFLGSSGKVQSKKAKKPEDEKVWHSHLTELTFASIGQEMGKQYEAQVKDVWNFIDSIDENKLTSKEIKALGSQGSSGTQRIVQLVLTLARNSPVGLSDTLWENVYAVPVVGRRQYSKLVQLLTSNKVRPKNVKQLTNFTLDLIRREDALFISSVKALAEFAAETALEDRSVLASLTDDQIFKLFSECDWKLPQKGRLIAVVIRRTPHFINGKDIFVGLERQTLFALEGSELFEILGSRGQLGQLLKPYVENFVRLSNDPSELFGILKVTSAIPASISKETINLAINKAFAVEGTYGEAWSEISGVARIKVLEQELEKSLSKVRELEANLSKADSEYVASKKYAETLNRQLSNAIESSHKDLDASNDAARLDAARAVAAMASSLFDAAIQAKSEVMAIVKPTLTRLGIKGTGDPGQELRFNPEFHMDPNGELKSGDLGILVTPGYTTSVGNEIAVLRKAIVTGK